MILDVTGVELTPGFGGVLCLGNGVYRDRHGRPIPCCCDECDYLLCCCDTPDCTGCTDPDCPWAAK